MIVRRSLTVLIAIFALPGPAPAVPAAAASKAQVLSNWTQPNAASYNSWNAARLDRGPWASYGFDWSTDYCSSSPDRPLGFDFTLSCWHHDFGYRNYKAVNQFPANKARVDSTFYADLKRKCNTYNVLVRPACLSLAWTYYEAVSIFGSVSAVKQADIEKARKMLPAGRQGAF